MCWARGSLTDGHSAATLVPEHQLACLDVLARHMQVLGKGLWPKTDVDRAAWAGWEQGSLHSHVLCFQGPLHSLPWWFSSRRIWPGTANSPSGAGHSRRFKPRSTFLDFFLGTLIMLVVSVRKTSVLKLEASGPITGDPQFSFGDSSSVPHPEVCSPYAKRSGGITAFIGTWVPE